MPLWVIANTDPADSDRFWSNDFGWTDLASATTFEPDDRDSLNLPLGGTWLEFQTQDQDDLNLIHCEFQELEAQGVDLSYVDYNTIYSMIERIRDRHDIEHHPLPTGDQHPDSSRAQ